MDDVRIGNTLRVIRIRKRLRQIDVARRAAVQREVVSRLERGGLGRVRYDTFLAVASALGIRADIRLRWQGGDLERVVNAAHAELHETLVRHLGTLPGWTWRPEVSFAIYGERGVIDILAWHPETRSLLVIELKTELVDPQEIVATMSRRVRLGASIAAELGWRPATVSAWVVVADTRTNHRRVLRHSGLLRTAFPADGHMMRTWLRQPEGRISALSYWTHVGPGAVRRAPGQPKRVRRSHPGSRASTASSEPVPG
jgi:transcriptional regulator with XRE-family HTH domain